MGPRVVSNLFAVGALALAATMLPLAHAAPFDFRLPFFRPRSPDANDQEPPKREARPQRGRDSMVESKPPRPLRELSDWEIAHCARVAFWEDAELATHNLQVSVEKGVATVDGPVPSEYLRKRALALISKLRGIRGIRDQVRVRASPAPAEPKPRHFPPVDQLWPASQLQPTPQVERASSGRDSLASRSEVDEQPSHASDENWQAATGRGRWLPSNGVHAGLLPPETMAKDELPSQPVVSLGAPVIVQQDQHSVLARRVEEVLKADPRFNEVRFSVIKKTVHLRGSVRQESHRVELLRSLEAIPEVEHVRGNRIEVGSR